MKVIKVGKTADSIGYILIIPNNVNKDSRILLSMTDVVGMGDVFTQEENGKNTISAPRIKALVEKADMPIMIPLIDSYVDEDGREISKPEKYEGESSEAYEKRYNAFKTKLSEYTEFYPQTLESKLFQCETIIHVCDLPFELHVPLCFQFCPNASTFKYMLLVSDVNNV